MSSVRLSNFRRNGHEHFEPGVDSDPQAQRRLRGHLEQIDYTGYASNREVLGQMLGSADAAKFQRLAVAVALARGRWVAAALAAAESGQPPSPQQVHAIAEHREAFDELREAYDALRRMVERGYVNFAAP